MKGIASKGVPTRSEYRWFLLIRRQPELLWASNWPHPGQADPPSNADLAAWRDRWIPDGERDRILVANPAEVYGF
jgi:D-galactarolactone isomerase